MSKTLINNSKSYFFKKSLWIAIGAFTVVIAASAIVNTKWLYLEALFCIPLLIYIYFKKNPFVFLFGLYAFLLPMDSFMLLKGSFAGQGLTKYLALLIILVLILKGTFEENFKRPDTTVIWLILLSFYSIFTLVWAIDPQLSIKAIRNIAAFPFFYLVVSSYKVHRKDFEILKWCIIGGGFVTALLSMNSYETLLQSGETFDRVSIVIGEDRFTTQNGLAFGLLIPASMSLEKIFQQKDRLRKLLIVIVLGSILLGIILTGSRGGMLGVGVIFSVYFLLSRKKVKFFTFIIPIVILIISISPSFLFERWGTAVETGGAGRTVIWYVGLKALQKYWLTGAGLYNFPAAYTEFADYASRYEGIGRAPHNIYLGMFVELGIIGFALMVLVFIRHYKAIKLSFKSGKYDFDSVMLKASFWSLLASSFFLDTFWDKPFWLLWMLIMIRKNTLGYEDGYYYAVHSDSHQ